MYLMFINVIYELMVIEYFDCVVCCCCSVYYGRVVMCSVMLCSDLFVSENIIVC